MPSRTYRHRPWQAWSAVIVLLLAVMGAPLVVNVVRAPSVDAVAKAFVGLIPLGSLAAYLVLSGLRVRTVIDDDAVTQHWITCTYRIAFDEITGLEQDHGSYRRWFLRVYRGEHTFEVIPCQVMGTPGGPFSPGPPLAMLAVQTAIEDRIGKRL